ncbi:MAG: tetratricopeptide repeat protein [Nitrospirae bacterium]|nr:tetratricopeptide repeat protein [Nitrospirota bacterium]
MKESPARNKIIFTCLFLAAAIFAVYSQTAGHQFVSYDDGVYITENPHVKAGLTMEGIYWAFTAQHESNWHPITWLSHMLDVSMFGLHPGALHLINTAYHAADTLLLFLLLLRMTGAHWPSALVAALFALHPMHVESVAWAAERKDVLSAFFWVLTLMLYERYVKRPGRMRYLLTICSFALGLLSKPMLVTLPLIMLLMDYWPLGRVQQGTALQQASGMSVFKSFPRRLIIEKVPFFALSAIISIVTIFTQHKGGAMASVKGLPFSFRAINALWSYVVYIGKMIWPMHLAVIYPLPSTLTIVQGLFSGLLLAGTTTVVLRYAKRHPYFLAGWLWYLITLVPVIGLVQVGRQSMSDRYTYIPSIGLFIMIAWGLQIVAGDNRFRRAAVTAIAGITLLALSACAWLQIGYWKDSITLFSHAVKTVAGNYVAHESLGYALAQGGSLDEAAYHYSEALRISPDYERALTGIGNVLVKQGKIKEGIYYTNKALLLNPDSAEAHFNMGFALMKQGHDEEAARHYSEGLRSDPENAEIHFILGVTLATQGRLDEAIRHFSEALRISPGFAEGHYSMGVALLRQGKFSDSIRHFSEALRLRPDFAEAGQSLREAMQLRDAPAGN